MLGDQLNRLQAVGREIKVGLVGVGRMGTGVVSMIAQMKVLRTIILADLAIENTVRAFKLNGVSSQDIIITDDPGEATDAINRGKVVATRDGKIVPQAPIDVVVEATGHPETGARVAFDSISKKKHIVMLNVETDVIVGPILKRLADNAGVIYTLTAGDEPGAIMELYDFATSLGFEIVAAGKSPMRPIDREATPKSLAAEAKKVKLNPKMLCSFRDGSKHSIEMAAVSNATGLVPDIRGMHVPQATVQELPKVFSLKKQGGILKRTGVVDMAAPILKKTGETDWIRSVTPGVFVVITTKHPVIKGDLEWLKMGSGPNYVLYRPYHLCDIETPLSIVRAAIYNEATLAPVKGLVSEVITVAKRDLKAGEVLDGSGGFTVYGVIEKAEIAKGEKLLPLGLAYDIPVKKAVKKGEPIKYNLVELDESSLVLQLRRLQDSTLSRN